MKINSRLSARVFYNLALAAVIACCACLFSAVPSHAQQAYWIVNGGRVSPLCPGKQAGEPKRAANGNNHWVLITATLTCKDVGDGYVLSLDYMSIQVNPSSRSRIERDVVNFDWIALAVYGANAGGKSVNWLYDEALPIHGSLPKDSRDKIYFGNLTFPKIPKAEASKATSFTLYLTAEGVVFAFGFK